MCEGLWFLAVVYSSSSKSVALTQSCEWPLTLINLIWIMNKCLSFVFSPFQNPCPDRHIIVSDLCDHVLVLVLLYFLICPQSPLNRVSYSLSSFHSRKRRIFAEFPISFGLKYFLSLQGVILTHWVWRITKEPCYFEPFLFFVFI